MKKKVSKKFSDIFIEQKDASASEDRSKESQSFQGFTYLKRGDSSAYIQQFIGKDEPMSPLRSEQAQSTNKPPPIVHQEPRESNSPSERGQAQEPQAPSEHEEQSYSATHANPSAFHNFQKHLTVALKHAVIFRQEDKTTKEYVKVAAKLWRAFSQSKICTKKVLHFLLGDHNEHQITNQDLRQFGFAKIYDSYGDRVVREARRFMLQEVLRQIKEENVLEQYFEHKKIKDKQKFKKYVSIFVEELETGFLRKRLPRQRVYELLHHV